MRQLLLAAPLILLAGLAHAQDENDMPDPGCKAEKQTVELFGKPEQQLTFTRHVCPKEVAPPITFAIKDGDTLVAKVAVDQPYESDVAKFWPLNSERPSQVVRMLSEPGTPAEERGRCIVQMDYVNGRYAWTPEVSYLEDLLKREEPFAACGTYGDSNDAIQYWKVIKGGIIGYFWLGQDYPFFDPDSFEFVNSKEPGKAG